MQAVYDLPFIRAGFLSGVALGALAAFARLSGNRFAPGAAFAYSALFRGVPDLLTVYLPYFGGSVVFTAIGAWFGAGRLVGLPGLATGAVALGVYAIPGLGNVWQLVLKDSALVSVIGLVELMRQAQVSARSTRRPFVFFCAAVAPYVAIATSCNALFRRVERQSRRGFRTA